MNGCPREVKVCACRLIRSYQPLGPRHALTLSTPPIRGGLIECVRASSVAKETVAFHALNTLKSLA